MRIAVTGREGQVVRSLVERARELLDVEVVPVGRPVLDLLRLETILPAIRSVGADVVVSAAAYTAVDRAEDEPEMAAAINAVGAGKVAEAAFALGIPVIHLSTDYVFSGDGGRPYAEGDPTGPQNVYGRTKLAGEEAVAAANPRHAILRTAWVYSPFGKNFVKTVLNLAADRETLPVVADQWGNPTSAHDIADAILAVASALTGNYATVGIYHVAGTGDTTWAGFASHVLDVSRICGGPWAEVREIATADLRTKAKRPANSRLSTLRFYDAFGWRAPDWQLSSRVVVERMLTCAGS